METQSAPTVFTPSKYQERIFEHVKTNAEGNGAVDAVAGSGKTRTLVEAADLIERGSFFAFNKHIATELNEKLKGTNVQARTIHSLGYGAIANTLGRPRRPDGWKYRNICQEWMEAQNWSKEDIAEGIGDMDRLQNLCRLNLVDPDDIPALEEIVAHHGMVPGKYVDGISYVIEKGLFQAKEEKLIDFTDMLYVPIVMNLNLYPNDKIFVDEAQDLSPAQLELTQMALAPGGRSLYVGDPYQAIYGFAGADADSFQNIVSRTEAMQLPLSICYRCPKSHIALAQEIVPQIEATPWADDGVLENIKEFQMDDMLQEGDLILCRTTQPLISKAIGLIKERKQARVRGKDIGKQIAKEVEKIAKMPGYDWNYFNQYADNYKREMIDYYVRKKASETTINNFCDRIECVLVVHEGYTVGVDNNLRVHDEWQLKSAIENLFSDERSAIWLSTVHRAKGLENKRVFIMRPDILPLVWEGQLDWQFQQEMNLKYVALTRATESLIIAHRI